MTRSSLQDAFDHHVWATEQLIDACASLTPEQLATPVPGTYGSIIETFRHLVRADRSYLFVISGGDVPEIDEREMNLGDLRAVMEQNAPVWSSVLAKNEDPDRNIVLHRDDGTDSTAPLGIRLAQAVHHGSEHRGQIYTCLTSLGIDPPDFDVWAFGEKDGRVFETS